MATRPGSYLNWVPSNNPDYVQEPDASQKTTGWVFNEDPPLEYMNWLFYQTDQWIQYFDASNAQAGYDVIVGSAPYAQYADLPTAIAANPGPNKRVLITSSTTTASVINLTLPGWHIECLPGVTYTASTTGFAAFSVQANDVWVQGLRLSGYTTGFTGTSAWTYGRLLFNNFYHLGTEVDDTSAPAGKKPITLGNISEVYP